MGDWWYGVVEGNVIKIMQTDDKLTFYTYPEALDSDFLRNYFRFDDALPYIFSQIQKDDTIARAIQKFHGLRLIRQLPWECLISYICATNKGIPAIQEMVFNLSKRYGRKICYDGYEFYSFPEPHTLANTGVRGLIECKLGYRAKYVSETSKRIADGAFDIEALKGLNYLDAKRRLLTRFCGRRLLVGVGPKVADCVLLFSLNKLDAFPVDVWVKRAIFEVYPHLLDRTFVNTIAMKKSLTHREYEAIASFGRRYFGDYAGYAQQYLFSFKHQQSNN